MSAYGDAATGGRDEAKAAARMVDAALKEAGVPPSDYDVGTYSHGESPCHAPGCELEWHVGVSWTGEKHAPAVWRALQLTAVKVGQPTLCYACWDSGDGGDCAAVGVEEDCGAER